MSNEDAPPLCDDALILCDMMSCVFARRSPQKRISSDGVSSCDDYDDPPHCDSIIQEKEKIVCGSVISFAGVCASERSEMVAPIICPFCVKMWKVCYFIIKAYSCLRLIALAYSLREYIFSLF